jgi:hypothetical protein
MVKPLILIWAKLCGLSGGDAVRSARCRVALPDETRTDTGLWEKIPQDPMLNHQLSNYHSIINQDVLRCVKWLIS